MKDLTRRLAVCLIALFLGLPLGSAAAEPIDIGEPFPVVSLPAPADPAQRAYLGLDKDGPFTLDQVEGKVVLVELLNVLCPHCRKQTGPYNALYRMLEDDPVTRGKVKMLGVAVANSDEQIEDFVDIYAVAFPVVSDRRFALHRALRAGPTPFSLYVLRDAPGEVGVVAGTALGEDDGMEALFGFLKELLTMKTADFVPLAETKTVLLASLEPPQTEGEVAALVETAMAALGDKVREVHRVSLASGRRVYAARVRRSGEWETIFAEVASRSAICDVCHNVHFFYLFDRKGKILAFEPLHLTKYGNVEWTEGELNRFAKRVVGRSMTGLWNFDPKVDAVTSATMTSAIIFDNFDQGQQLLDELKAAGEL
jgi:peroxiredoxin